MTYIKITNTGEIDPIGLRLMGASSKDGENKIGFFGTGTKYSIAYALRNNIGLRVFSGEREIEIKTHEVSFRGETFNEISIDGVLTSLTTRTGPQWEAWYVLREFLCNAIDEGEHDYTLSSVCDGEAGKTSVYIELTESMQEVYDAFDEYFCFDRDPVQVIGEDKILSATHGHPSVFRRGIRIWKGDKPEPIFYYDLKDMGINEMRCASSLFDVQWNVMNTLKQFASVKVVNLLLNNRAAWEWTLDWSYGIDEASPAWEQCLKDVVVIPKESARYYASAAEKNHVILPHSACMWLYKNFSETLTILGCNDGKSEKPMQIVDQSAKQKDVIAYAVGFLKMGGFDASKYPIEVAELKPRQMGAARNGTIYIAEATFDMGRRLVIETVLEEFAHLESSEADETRAFQDALIRYVVNAIETQTGQYA